ncbi:glycosyltransferase family 2 protein [Quadrisphaera oryzae]|uniref:glycosyltransferase family 2 protein n=1 Tax=Quadrisphaera TaxID=317661 RepID=UPI0016486438|nr:hypothetical protein [Quadrisphaera sp. RL12-1S]MBC3763787.1 hypothetical protein [Quadrisphaera sp. RL12-1S]
MLSILLPTARRTAPGQEQTAWDDLRVALASVKAYAPGVEVIVGWAGAEEPRDLPANPAMRLLRQPPGITTGSEAWNWCAEQAGGDELLILGDDCVLHPDSVTRLLEDVALLRAQVPAISLGFVGARTNFAKGPQNVRYANEGQLGSVQFSSEAEIHEVPMVVPVLAWVEKAVFDGVGGFPATNWFADDLISWDLTRTGHRHFISRSYVHHVGQRASAQGRTDDDMLQAGLQWLRAHRPDFLASQLPAELLV